MPEVVELGKMIRKSMERPEAFAEKTRVTGSPGSELEAKPPARWRKGKRLGISMALEETPMNKVKAENEISKPRGSVFPKELRDLSNMVASFAKDFPFAEDKVDKLLKKLAAVQQADRIRESRAQADLDKLWAILRMLFRNKIELSIRKLPENGPDEQKNEDYRRMKEFLRRMGAKV